MAKLTLAIDAMGGDRGPSIVVAALIRALQSFPEVDFILTGDEPRLKALLNREAKHLKATDRARIRIHHTTQIVQMDDKPSQCLRHKTDSSMRIAIDLIAEGDAQACVSAGNTGALMAMAYLRLKVLPGVLRPALIAPIPNEQGGQSLLLDLGANPQCDADTLFQFGVMGSVIAQELTGISEPRIALLNMGTEEIKGPDVVKQAALLLANSKHVHYQGFIEGSDLFAGKADVIVCDGFTGNIALKSCEGMARMVYDHLKRSLKSHWLSRALVWLLYRRQRKAWSWLNPDQYNGASLIGLRGVVVKSHGNASANAFYSAIEHAIAEAESDLPKRIHDRVEQVLSEQHT
ncbi:phosphate acyltransferase PlsX [Aliidiomarina halalkaliphila]|uniref:Phosphate acyltransferase n=1 Tax=Aliidiomarina halalkaliphila TaxID=2593535 RepID=A0A552X446_9GAMM|nr:phosphate acyltransferase PlsX [Aliidiomarina halalkaliphila]TRW49802.1 phosphate acyltransferase PlsX [Aliidiomarina halalkaliphila]